MGSEIWITLMIGNSRLHWGLFQHEQLIDARSTQYRSKPQIQQFIQQPTLEHFIKITNSPPLSLPSSPPQLFILLASVVPSQTQLWQDYPQVRTLSLSNIPIQNMYPSMGIDRAIALFAGGEIFGFPTLVIDAGTALTLTAASPNHTFIGGAILPGFGLQLETLANRTGQLPQIELSNQLTPRWAMNTQDAIQSGIIYTLLAGIKDFIENWWQDFPTGKVILTGGDAANLSAYMSMLYPKLSLKILKEDNLVLQGMGKLIHQI